jgi:hypothetical protein
MNTITVRPAAGVTGKTISASLTSAVVDFDDADFVVLDGRPGGSGTMGELTIQNTATSGTAANTIQFTNGATYNTVRYVRALNGTAATAGPRTIAFAASASNPAGNSNNLILNCIIEGGRTGVGSSGTTANPNVNNTIRGCQIREWGFAGVWMQAGTNGMTLDSNSIYQTVGQNVTNPAGVTLAVTSSITATIARNRIYDIRSTSTSTGLTIRGIYTQLGPGAGSVLNIENNFISLTLNNNNAASIYGILLTGANDYTANIYYNSILVGGTHSGGTAPNIVSAALVKNTTGPATAFNMKNNLFMNNRTGGNAGVTHTGGAISDTSGVIDIDYNIHWAGGAGGAASTYHATWGPNGYDSLPAYRMAAAPNEIHTVFDSVQFVSNTDLHLSGTSIGNTNMAGTLVPWITIDIDADERSVSVPYKGADERPEAPITSVADKAYPAVFSLSQNYPNPFNPKTVMSYELGVKSEVRLIVYDLLGREVATLVHETKGPASYDVTFDASHLASGVYFCRLTAGSFSQTRKLVLMK